MFHAKTQRRKEERKLAGTVQSLVISESPIKPELIDVNGSASNQTSMPAINRTYQEFQDKK
ncbi:MULTISPECIES: hypothetical protein [unclassified Anabaena]|uniref:hypothetical protein n=1 Tax=unclassified Anabaena TaxID=2619674 RepID=UPI0039C5E23B